MIVAIDTSSELTSVAVVDGTEVVAEAEHRDARKHAEVAAPLLAEVLARVPEARASTTTIACGVGPGPYTGLRVGIATAIALGLAWDVPVVGVCSLDAVAEEAVHGGQALSGTHEAFHVAIDARRQEIYWGGYDALANRVSGPMVSSRADLPEAVRAGIWLGPEGTFPHARWIARRVDRLLRAGESVADVRIELDVHGSDGSATARALHGASLLPPSPLYLRRPDAKEARA